MESMVATIARLKNLAGQLNEFFRFVNPPSQKLLYIHLTYNVAVHSWFFLLFVPLQQLQCKPQQVLQHFSTFWCSKYFLLFNLILFLYMREYLIISNNARKSPLQRALLITSGRRVLVSLFCFAPTRADFNITLTRQLQWQRIFHYIGNIFSLFFIFY